MSVIGLPIPEGHQHRSRLEGIGNPHRKTMWPDSEAAMRLLSAAALKSVAAMER